MTTSVSTNNWIRCGEDNARYRYNKKNVTVRMSECSFWCGSTSTSKRMTTHLLFRQVYIWNKAKCQHCALYKLIYLLYLLPTTQRMSEAERAVCRSVLKPISVIFAHRSFPLRDSTLRSTPHVFPTPTHRSAHAPDFSVRSAMVPLRSHSINVKFQTGIKPLWFLYK